MKTLLLVLVLLVAGCATGDDFNTGGSEFYFVAPDGQTHITYNGDERKSIRGLSGPSLMQDGATVSLDDYHGQVVVVNIWGSWCGPCRAEVPELQKIHSDNEKLGVRVLGIDVKEPSIEPGRDFMRNRQVTYPSIYDDSGRAVLTFRGLPPNHVPSTVVLDKQHRVAAVFIGALLATDLIPLVTSLASE